MQSTDLVLLFVAVFCLLGLNALALRATRQRNRALNNHPAQPD